MTIRDLLQRFRPAGTPGAARPAAVPVDRRAQAAAELAPVFAALASSRAEAARIRTAAGEEAELRRRQAAAEAERIMAMARQQARTVRSDAFAAVVGDAQRAGGLLLASAQADVVALRHRAGQRLPDAVALVVSTALRAADGDGEA